MAEALMKLRSARRIEAYSAGIDPGEEVNPEAVKAMREVGYDLSGNCCKHVSQFKKIKFDFVAKMDAPDLGNQVKARWIETWDVPDPAQGGIDEFRKVRDLLSAKVERLLVDWGHAAIGRPRGIAAVNGRRALRKLRSQDQRRVSVRSISSRAHKP
jgi:arsenate reductase